MVEGDDAGATDEDDEFVVLTFVEAPPPVKRDTTLGTDTLPIVIGIGIDVTAPGTEEPTAASAITRIC